MDLASATEVSVDILPAQSQSSRAVDQARGVPHAKSAADLVNKIKQLRTVSQSTMDQHDSDSFVVPQNVDIYNDSDSNNRESDLGARHWAKEPVFNP